MVNSNLVSRIQVVGGQHSLPSILPGRTAGLAGLGDGVGADGERLKAKRTRVQWREREREYEEGVPAPPPPKKSVTLHSQHAAETAQKKGGEWNCAS